MLWVGPSHSFTTMKQASLNSFITSNKKQKVEASSSSEAFPSEAHAASPWRGAFEALDPSWKARLSGEMQKPYVNDLVKFLDAESCSHTVFPPKDQVWTALNLVPYERVKVVILGQDPYHGPNQAHGLAFSVVKGVQVPPSLRNMVLEASRDPDLGGGIPEKAPHGNLECWSRQGVLLLNTVLTVRRAEANSHQRRGWEQFTDAILRELGKREGIVYLLWGSAAQAKGKNIDQRKNRVITCAHPSPLSAHRGFMGSRCFSQCNKGLLEFNHTTIDWRIV